MDLTNIGFVFLDRDGVLNQKPAKGRYITSCEQLRLLPSAAEAVAVLNQSGRKVIVVTNQRGVALGLYSLDELARIHEKLSQQLALAGARLDAIYFCPHDEGQCDCRKPGIGMFKQAFRDFPEAKPERCLMVGDSLRDIEAGVSAGMMTAFVTDGTAMSAEDLRARAHATVTIRCLSDMLKPLLGHETNVLGP